MHTSHYKTIHFYEYNDHQKQNLNIVTSFIIFCQMQNTTIPTLFTLNIMKLSKVQILLVDDIWANLTTYINFVCI